MEPGLDGLPGLMPSTRRRRALGTALICCAFAGMLAGCAGEESQGTPAQQITTYMNDGGGGSGIGNVEVDSRNVALALSQHNKPAAIREVCALLSNDAQTAIGNLPTPDNDLTDALNNAYMVATAAGDDCYRGAGGNARLLARSAAERAKLVTLLDEAIARVSEVTGRTPTTETTVPPTDNGDPFAPAS
jgi:hypothetical protein